MDGSAYTGGDPDCNQGTTLLVERGRGRYLPLLPNDEKTKRLFAEILATVGAISTVTTDAGTGASLLPYRVAGAFARHPKLALRSLARVLALVASGRIPLPFLHAIATGGTQTINIGTHNFMDASRVAQAADDPVTQARLDACVFKGAVKNRATGKCEAIPMCAMNHSRWSELFAKRLSDRLSVVPSEVEE